MFSIIIPVYNSEKYIVKCLESILKQNYNNYEIIVVDDGSTDNSINLIKKINSNKIKILSKKNGGLSSARNYGVKYANNDYIWFIDSDDYIEPNSLKKLSNIISKCEYDIVSFQYYKDYGTKKILMVDENDKNNLYDNVLINTSACTKIFRTEFYKKNSFYFPEGKIYEDLALIPYVLSCTSLLYYFECPLYNYVFRNNSIMNSKVFKENRDDKFYAIDNLYLLFSKNKKYNEYNVQLEYLTIKHLLIVYSSEILLYNKKIYYNRCLNVLNYLNNLNKLWYENCYIKKLSFKARLYIFLFRKKLFKICKYIILIKNIFL